MILMRQLHEKKSEGKMENFIEKNSVENRAGEGLVCLLITCVRNNQKLWLNRYENLNK